VVRRTEREGHRVRPGQCKLSGQPPSPRRALDVGLLLVPAIRSLLKLLGVQAVMAVGLTACAAIVGVKDGTLEDAGGADGTVETSVAEGGADGAADRGVGPETSGDAAMDSTVEGSLQDSTSDASDANADAASDVLDAGADADSSDANDATADADSGGCTSQVVDAGHAVFVAAGGSDAGGTCGAITAPCGSVQLGIDRANVMGVGTIVYVAAGTYTESVSLVAGVTVQGGWDYESDGGWAPVCTGNPAQAVVIAAPSNANVTVQATDIGGAALLQTLTIASMAQSAVQPGESIYGIVATGSTTLALDDVVVSVVGGGGGSTGMPGDGGAPAVGSCTTAGTGSSGPGGSVGPASDGGTFSVAGYAAGEGLTGTAGMGGDNGTAGGSPLCADCVSTTSCGALSCSITSTTLMCGAPGMPGCGGGGGAPGAGGTGGGSSIALFVWGATVNCAATSLTAGNGGPGGAGGAGGNGGTGSAGQAGAGMGTCNTTVAGSCLGGCVDGTPVALDGGDAGGTGGPGGAGGPGGGGAGGWSCAYYQGPGGQVSFLGGNSSTTPGAAGAGGAPGGAPGLSKDRCP